LSVPYAVQLKQIKSKETTTKQLPASIEQIPLSDAEAENLRELIRNNQYYMIRVKPNSAEERSEAAMTSVLACTLIESNFRDRIGLYFNRDGRLVGLVYETRSGVCSDVNTLGGSFPLHFHFIVNAHQKILLDLSNLTSQKEFKSNLFLSFPNEAPKLAGIHQIETEKKEEVRVLFFHRSMGSHY
jgi:hypothetical protein